MSYTDKYSASHDTSLFRFLLSYPSWSSHRPSFHLQHLNLSHLVLSEVTLLLQTCFLSSLSESVYLYTLFSYCPFPSRSRFQDSVLEWTVRLSCRSSGDSYLVSITRPPIVTPVSSLRNLVNPVKSLEGRSFHGRLVDFQDNFTSKTELLDRTPESKT